MTHYRTGFRRTRIVRHSNAALVLVLVSSLTACLGAPPTTLLGTPAVTVGIIAKDSLFDRTQVNVVAGSSFAIRFENQDTIPHNVSISGGPTTLVGEIFTGPAERTYYFASLPEGTYTFLCDVHPAMKGMLRSD